MRASRSDSQGCILSRQPGRTNGLPPAELLLLWPGGLRVGRRGGRQSTYQIVCQAPEQNCCARRSDTPKRVRDTVRRDLPPCPQLGDTLTKLYPQAKSCN